MHENYLHQKMPDPDLKAIMIANQWFCFHDLLQYHVNHMQNYTVYPYLQYSFVKVHQLLGSYSLPKLRFPTKAFEVKPFEEVPFCYRTKIKQLMPYFLHCHFSSHRSIIYSWILVKAYVNQWLHQCYLFVVVNASYLRSSHCWSGFCRLILDLLPSNCFPLSIYN